jgi:hypothetical protein
MRLIDVDLKAAKGDNWRQMASNEKRQIATNLLQLFVTFWRSGLWTFFSNRLVGGWCRGANQVSRLSASTSFVAQSERGQLPVRER